MSLTSFLMKHASKQIQKGDKKILPSLSVAAVSSKPMHFAIDGGEAPQYAEALLSELVPSTNGLQLTKDVSEHIPAGQPHKFYVDFVLPDDIPNAYTLLPLIRGTLAEFLVSKKRRAGRTAPVGGEEADEADEEEDGEDGEDGEEADSSNEAPGSSRSSNAFFHVSKAVVLEAPNRYTRVVFPRLLVKPAEAAIMVFRIAAAISARDRRAMTYRWQDVLTSRKIIMAESEPRGKKRPPSFFSAYSRVSKKCEACSSAAETSRCIACGQTGFVVDPSATARIAYVACFDPSKAGVSPALPATERIVVDAGEKPPLSALLGACLFTTQTGEEVEDAEDAVPGRAGSSTAPLRPLPPPHQPRINFPMGTPHCPNADGRSAKPTGGLWRANQRGFVAARPNIVAHAQRTIRKTFKRFHSSVTLTQDNVHVKVNSKILAYAQGLGSNTCACKGKDHKDSYVWFEITPLGIKQLCGSKEEVGGVECRLLTKRQPYTKLPMSTIRALFPGSKEARAGSAGGGSSLDLADSISATLVARHEPGAARRLSIWGFPKSEF